MAERLTRAQILLEPAQHRALAELARREGKSISEMVREMVNAHLEQERERKSAERAAAWERIEQHRNAILARRGGKPLDFDVVQVINEGREERDERNLEGLKRSRG